MSRKEREKSGGEMRRWVPPPGRLGLQGQEGGMPGIGGGAEGRGGMAAAGGAAMSGTRWSWAEGPRLCCASAVFWASRCASATGPSGGGS